MKVRYLLPNNVRNYFNRDGATVKEIDLKIQLECLKKNADTLKMLGDWFKQTTGILPRTDIIWEVDYLNDEIRSCIEVDLPDEVATMSNLKFAR